jgi:hypothetical protein
MADPAILGLLPRDRLEELAMYAAGAAGPLGFAEHELLDLSR